MPKSPATPVTAGQLCLADDLRCCSEGDVLPYDESAGWVIFNPCDEDCTGRSIDYVRAFS
jgi:hypothetical protein